MSHPLASTFTSRTFDKGEKELVPDLLRDFDLTRITDTGAIGDGCFRRPTGRPITGKAREVAPHPLGYQVEIDQEEADFTAYYKGIAFFDDPEEKVVTKIAGFVKIVSKDAEKAAEIRRRFRFGENQDETTWVVTKP